jgi:aminopeptidase N
MKSFLALASLLLLLVSGCTNGVPAEAVEIVPGVSRQLATHRKKVISRINYSISLNIPDGKEPIRASESITFDLSDHSLPVQLDFKEEKQLLRSLNINGKTSRIDFTNEHIVLPAEKLKTGTNVVEIVLTCGDKSLNRKEDLLYSLFVPEKARTFIPCFDQPDLKASFTLHADVPNDWEVITNSEVVEESVDGKRKHCRFADSDTMSTYLFSVVAGKFRKEVRKTDGRKMNLYYRETNAEKIAESTDSIFSQHLLSLKFMEDYTGIPYPFRKFDIIAIPDFTYGGMEHVGAIDYRSDILFLDKTATQTERLERLNAIAHETAHMWFGNLVTMEWFDDVWMKEVFANFMAGKITKSVMPDVDGRMRFLLYNHPEAYSVDRTRGANPIRQKLENLDQAGSLYGEIIYQKAPIVMAQLESVCGEERLKRGLRQYLKKYAFGNASWPQLITILDRISDENLAAWNEQWINKPGMPVYDYTIKTANGVIQQISVDQTNPGSVHGQRFSISLVYEDRIQTIAVRANSRGTLVKKAVGSEVPLFIVFNSTGEGYGAFPADLHMLRNTGRLSPLMRASVYLNAYENVLDGRNITPEELIRQYAVNFETENEEQIVSRMGKHFRNLYWQFLTVAQRSQLQESIERRLLEAIKKTSLPGKKRMLFLTYVSVFQSDAAVKTLYAAWKTKKNDLGVVLSDEDYITLACAIAIRKPSESGEILAAQRARIRENERRQRFDFVLPALSPDSRARDRFFASLADRKNRENEVAVLEALGYLHHPLRLQHSEKYLPKSLELLEELQKTGDIFFPSDWLRFSLNYYQSKNAAHIVRQFLEKHPDYNPTLRQKILQEADDLFRARKILARGSH